jgi:hypothetical protein
MTYSSRRIAISTILSWSSSEPRATKTDILEVVIQVLKVSLSAGDTNRRNHIVLLLESPTTATTVLVGRDKLVKNERNKVDGRTTDTSALKPARTSYANVVRKGTKRKMKVSFLKVSGEDAPLTFK